MFKNLRAPTFHTNRLFIRLIDPIDINGLYEVSKSSNVTRYLTFNPHKSIRQTRMVIENMLQSYFSGHSVNFAIIEKNLNKMIGSVSLTFSMTNNSAEIGYILNDNFWNKGYMSEVIEKLIDISFTYYGLDTLFAKHILENEASKRILLKNNFKLTRIVENGFTKNFVSYTILEYILDKNTYFAK